MSAESRSNSKFNSELFDALLGGRPLKGSPYNSIVLSSREPGIIDDINAPLVPSFVTSYWPGGNPITKSNIEAFSIYGNLAPLQHGAEVSRIRSAILGTYIGAAALERIPDKYYRYWREVERQLPSPITKISELCGQADLPLAVCATFDVADPEPSDRTAMYMWYPDQIHPEPVLKELQKAQQACIDQEKIVN